MNKIKEIEDYQKLSYKIGKFNSVQSQLKDGRELLNKARSTFGENSEIYKKFEKEYKELASVIEESYESEKSFTKDELTKIKLELGDLVKLAKDNNIEEKKGWVSKAGDFIKGTDTKTVKDEAINFMDKNIDDFKDKDEIFVVLTKLNKDYKQYKKVDGKLEKAITLNYSTINELDDQYEVRIFQDKLIEKILGKDIGFNDNFIKGFNSEKGSHLIKIDSFEKNIQNGNLLDLNSLGLKNYYNYLLKSKGENGIIEYLKNRFGIDKCKQIGDFIKRQKDNNDFLQILDRIGNDIKEIGKSIIGSISEFFSNFLKSSNPLEIKNNLSKIKDNATPEEKKEFSEMLKEDLNDKNSKFKNIFIQALSNKGLPEKKIQEIVKDLILKLNNNLSVEKLGDAYILIEDFNKKYKLDINGKDTITTGLEAKFSTEKSEALKLQEEINSLNISLIRAVDKGDEKLIKEIKGKLAKLSKSQKSNEISLHSTHNTQLVNDKVTIAQAKDIGTGKIKYKKLLAQIIEETPDLAEQIKETKKLKKEFKQEFNEDYIDDYAKKEDLKENKEKEVKTKEDLKQKTSLQQPEIQINIPTNEYIQTQGGYELITQKGSIILTNKEFDLIKNNPKAKENLINFRNTLEELNIDGLWKFRANIFKVISNKYPINFKIDGDFVNPQELKIFLISILKSLKIDINFNSNINDIKQKIKDINKSGTFFKTTEVSNLGGYIETNFTKKFSYLQTGGFKFDDFKNSI